MVKKRAAASGLLVVMCCLAAAVSACGGGDVGGVPSTDLGGVGGGPSTDLVDVGDCLLHMEGSADPAPVPCDEGHDFEVILVPSEQACIELNRTNDLPASAAVSHYARVSEGDASAWVKENDLVIGIESNLSYEAGEEAVEATGWCYIGLRKMMGESGEWVTWEGSLRGAGVG